MADYQQVIEFLRDVRQGASSGGGLQTVTEEIGHMAAEYAALCATANDRLRKCSSFLQQGLRTEAIHLAEETPNLLDLVSQLDLPDPQAWAEFCQNNGFPVPPALQLERAAQLNEAYAQDQPLEHLLARHRLLALSRAPVRERLDVMRKLAAIDVGNTYWEKDIRILEQARLKEFPSVFYNAVKNHDHRAITGLMEELTQEQWFEAPSADLTNAVTEACGRVQRAGVEFELRKLVEPLREAYAARSLQECQALVQRWKNAMTAAGVTHVSSELTDEVKPVVAFIAEQTKRDDFLKRFQETCKAFRKLLDADADDAQLEAGYARLREFHEEIPEDLTKRYLAKRGGRRQDAERRHKLRLATIAGIFAFFIITGLAVAWILSRTTNADRWARGINDAVALHTLEGLQQAQKNVDDLKSRNPKLLDQPSVAKAISALQVAQQRFESDAAGVKRAIARLETARQAASQIAGRANATMEEIRAAAAEFDAAINEAAEVLKEGAWADEGGKLRTAVAGAQAIRQNMQERMSTVARNEVLEVTAALNRVPTAPSTPAAVTQVQNQLTALADRADRLAGLPLLDSATTTAVASLREQIAKRRLAANDSGNVADELENIRKSSGSAADLRNALTRFINRFPGHPRAADFKAALDRLPPVETLESWQTRLADYKGAFAPSGLADAQKRLDDVAGFLSAHPDLPKAADVSQYCYYLKRAIDSLGKGPWQTTLEPLTINPLLADLSYLEVSDGRRYYIQGDPKRVEHKINGQTSVTFETLDLKPDAEGKVDYMKRIPLRIDYPLKVSEAPILAPHAKAVRDIADGLQTINEANWDTFGIDIADRLAHNDQMDIVVKAILLQQVLNTELIVTGTMLGDTYQRTLDALARLKPDELPWPDPAKVPDSTRKAIKTIVDEMPKANDVRQRLANAKAALFKSLTLDVAGTGVLLKDDDGAWVLYSSSPPGDGLTLWTVSFAAAPAAGAPAPSTLVLIGNASGARFVLDNAALRKTPQGSIVFIVRQ
jgi:hypothetical protein